MIEVDIVTPQKKLVEGLVVSEVKVPTEKGEIQVLPGHTQLLSLLGPGVLSFKADGTERNFAVSYGFVEIKNNRVTVLAETCEESTNIDKSRAALAQKKSEEALAATLTEQQFKKYQLKLQRAITRQNISV
jgi:F-type H+-transporting ATPase subunit epsilon